MNDATRRDNCGQNRLSNKLPTYMTHHLALGKLDVALSRAVAFGGLSSAQRLVSSVSRKEIHETPKSAPPRAQFRPGSFEAPWGPAKSRGRSARRRLLVRGVS